MARASASARSELEHAYCETTYRVHPGAARAIDLHPGRRSPALDRLLARLGARECAVITAWNPGSHRLPRWRNARRQRRLLAVLAAGRYPTLRATGMPDSGDWPPEDSLLALRIARGRAVRIARCFGQNAILAVRRGGRAELAWARPPPA